MGGQVSITQSEPVFAADARQLGQDVPGLARHPPAGLAVVHAGQGVGHGVDVGADVQAVQHHVVTHVDQCRDVGGVHDAHQAREHPGGADAAAQGDQHGVSIESWLGRSARAALVRSPPAMPQQIALDRHRTVVSVLREAASVNGDVEAYVEPATRGTTRRSLTFGAWDRAADGVAGLLAHHGVGKGDVVCLLLPVLHRLRRPLRGPATPRRHDLGNQPPHGGGRGGLHRRTGRPGPRRRRPRRGVAAPRYLGRDAQPRRGSGRVGRSAARWLARARLPRSRRCGVDQRHDRPAQGGGLRPCQPGRRRPRHRPAQPSRRPPSLPAALRPRRLHDPRLGRGGARRHDRDHPHALEGRRRHPDHRRGTRHRGSGRAHPVGLDARQRRTRAGRSELPAHRQHGCRRARRPP